MLRESWRNRADFALAAMGSAIGLVSIDYLKKFGIPESLTDLLKHQHIIRSMRNSSNLLIFPNKEEISAKMRKKSDVFSLKSKVSYRFRIKSAIFFLRGV